jgi:hypothetical protein
MGKSRQSDYRASSSCIGGIGCVEVNIQPDKVLVRSSTRRRKKLELTPQEWRDLIAGIKQGEFDIS